tara:strand:+ start:269 stop:1516 length:1248 start_codon:yes stop_codon:yes gene_type:complete
VYVKIKGTKNFCYNGKPLPELPFVVDQAGKPFDELNDYILYLAGPKDKDLDATVRLAVLRILVVLNRLCEGNSEFQWRHVTDSHLELLMNNLKLEGHKKRKLQRDTINNYISAFIAFLWWAEKNGICDGVVGINDVGVSDRLYQVALEPSAQRGKQYKIPFLLFQDKTKRGGMRKKDARKEWDRALALVTQFDAGDLSDQSVAKLHRDEMILRLFLESSLRRIEVIHLTVGLFSEPLNPGERKKIITLPRTKIYDARDVGIHSSLYSDIQSFIATSRKELVLGKKRSVALIPSLKTGGFFKPNSITNLCRQFGVTPHDGRAEGLTERFIELIELGVSQTTAILTVSQEAGHKIENRNAGNIFLKYYLRAERIVAQANAARDKQVSLAEENAALRKGLNNANEALRKLGHEVVEVL